MVSACSILSAKIKMQPDPHIRIFQAERRRLAGLAYRMIGSVTEAEDILQQAWINWSQQDMARIDTPSRWLGAVVTRLCLDYLKSARVRRETYVGAWLPEPLVQDISAGPEQDWMVTEDVSMALVLTLETLTPEMRAAFLLRDAFDYSFEEIAKIVGRSPVTCRQLVSRARKKLAGAEPPAHISTEEALPITTAFWDASRTGNLDALLKLFAEDIEIHSDGGGRVPAAVNIVRHARRAAVLFVGISKKFSYPQLPCPPMHRINGAPGFVTSEAGNIVQTTSFEIRDGKIAAIWIVRNPDKLRHISRAITAFTPQ